MYRTYAMIVPIDGSLYRSSQKLFIRLQTGAGIFTLLTGEALAIGEVNKLVRLG